jgi:hypothetical protein
MRHQGGYLIAYENDNTTPKDVLISTRLSKLTMIVEYPKAAPEPVQLWIQRCARGGVGHHTTYCLVRPVWGQPRWLHVPGVCGAAVRAARHPATRVHAHLTRHARRARAGF